MIRRGEGREECSRDSAGSLTGSGKGLEREEKDLVSGVFFALMQGMLEISAGSIYLRERVILSYLFPPKAAYLQQNQSHKPTTHGRKTGQQGFTCDPCYLQSLKGQIVPIKSERLFGHRASRVPKGLAGSQTLCICLNSGY